MSSDNKLKKMDLVSKLHQKFVVDVVKTTDWDAGAKSPLIVELDTTEVCNLACPGCISEDVVSRNTGFTSERLLNLGKEFVDAGVKGVILIGGGEPLAHPAVGKLMTLLGENDVHIGITTNGTYIHKYLDIIAKYSQWTRVSMDAASDVTYKKLRPTKKGTSLFPKVVNNMEELAKVKKGKLGFSFLIRTKADGFGIESNIDDIYEAAVLAKNIGCDYYEVKPSYQFENGKNHFLRVHSQFDMDHAREEIARLSELETDNFKIIKSINLEYSLSGEQHTQPKTYSSCPSTELRTLVTPSGVYVCPYFRGKERMKVGDIHEQTFMEMWNSAERKDVMAKLNPSCDCGMHCIRHETNLELFEMIKKAKLEQEIQTTTNDDNEDRFI